MEINFSGLASGLDTQALIAALVSVEHRPIDLLQNRRSQLQQQRTLFKQFDGLLKGLKDKAEEFADSNSFLSLSSSLSSDGFFTATADSDAQVAAHDIKVLQLAVAGREVSTGVADLNTTTFGTGTITLGVGGDTTLVNIDTNNNTLSEIVDAINASDAGVQASIIDDGQASPYRIVIEAEDTGEDNALSVDFGTVTLAIDGALTRDADDATIVVDGLTIDRATNTIEGAIAGVTLNLIQDTDTDDDGNFDSIRLDVTVDRKEIRSRLQEFVDSYNEIITFNSDQARYNEDSKSAGPLSGDTTLRSIVSRLQSEIGTPLSDQSAALRTLSDIGIKLGDGGKLIIDEEDLDEALEGDLDELAAIFTDENEGIAVGLEVLLTSYTDKIDGLVKARLDGIDDRIKNVNDSIERAERRLESFEQNLVNRYAAFEGLIGGLNAQGAYLSSVFR